MIVSAILAAAKNNVIGKDNKIPWHLSADLKYFKKTTLNHHIIMGRKTYSSIGKPLPKRSNIIVTRNPYFIVSNCIVVHSIDEALEIALDNGEEEVFIIGGGEIYQQSMPYLDKIYLTEVDLELKGDTHFPKLDNKEWKLISEVHHPADDKNDFAFSFKVLERIV
ncbi:MAG TPA: type 3 dihydrofolate reductase [Saprospiraceae bacterium]|nr:type 3 dihydrofolate reductase [Saprospiraceae bacterium]